MPEKLVVQFASPLPLPFPLVAPSSPRETVSGAATLGSTIGPEGPGPEGREEWSSGAVEFPEPEGGIGGCADWAAVACFAALGSG